MIRSGEGPCQLRWLPRVYRGRRRWWFGACVLCGLAVERGEFCPGCLGDLPWNERGCEGCARPLPAGATSPRCGICPVDDSALTGMIAAVGYDYPVNRLVTGLKYHGRLGFVRPLAELLVRRVIALSRERSLERPDLLVPVPLHPRRFAARGFNQAEEIANLVGGILGVPVDARVCKRLRDTPGQAGLDAGERRRNLRFAFHADERAGARHVVLIDDVITTRATAFEAGRAIRQAGARRVDAWALALAAA